jgi:hypothetical protein
VITNCPDWRKCGLILVLLLCQRIDAKEHNKKKPISLPIQSTPVLISNDVHFQKRIDPGALQAQLIAGGFAIRYIDCSVDNCTIHMQPTETKDPMPIVGKYVYVDPWLERQKKVDTMRTLYSKWQDGTITPEEKDDLLKRLAAHVLGL